MPAFDYLALDQEGKQLKGALEADNLPQVRSILRDKGLTPLSVKIVNKYNISLMGVFSKFANSVKAYDLALITRQLATLIQAGLPLESALKTTVEQSEKPEIRRVLLAVCSKVLEGQSFAASLNEFPNIFPEMYRATIAAGERSGHLDVVLTYLADYTEFRHQSYQKIQLALLYPAILTIVSIIIVGFLLGYVFPDVIQVFVSSGQELPSLTKGLIFFSDFIKSYGLFLLGILILAIFAFVKSLEKEEVKITAHKKLINLPFIGKLVKAINISRFSNTMSILARSGVPLVEALKISATVMPNMFLKHKVYEAAKSVSEGSSLKSSLEKCGYFPPMLLNMIASGESSGRLDDMLEKSANNQQKDLENRIAVIVGLFEPLVILLMGGIVLLLVLSILLPILNLNQLIN